MQWMQISVLQINELYIIVLQINGFNQCIADQWIA